MLHWKFVKSTTIHVKPGTCNEFWSKVVNTNNVSGPTLRHRLVGRGATHRRWPVSHHSRLGQHPPRPPEEDRLPHQAGQGEGFHPHSSQRKFQNSFSCHSLSFYIPPCLGVPYKTFTNRTHSGTQRLKKEPGRRGQSTNPKVCRILTRIFILTSTYTLPTTYCPCVIPGPKQTPISIQQQDLMLKEKKCILSLL